MAKSVFAEIQRQMKASQRQTEQRKRAAVREHNAAVREYERTQKAAERAAVQAVKATEADRKRLEKEAKAAHVEAKLAQVAQMNAELAETYDAIDSLLAATLDVDDYVDLQSLRRDVEHPPFERVDLESPIEGPREVLEPEKPEYQAPQAPKGVFGKKKKAEQAEAEARAELVKQLDAWQVEMDSLPGLKQEAKDEHAKAETERLEQLTTERKRYDQQCAEREAEVAEHNAAIETLITNLGYGTTEAIEEYVSIVLSNSIYPTEFEVTNEFEFDSTTAELRLRVLVPGPDTVPTTKTHKYTKTTDEITSTDQSQKASKDRYLGAVEQVALRTLHEIFEADRRGLVKTISLELGTQTIDPATGKPTYIPFVAVAAEREVFVEFDLSAVLPSATLEHLGASVSKNPFGLISANTSGIRTA